jgi:hypothetical protein
VYRIRADLATGGNYSIKLRKWVSATEGANYSTSESYVEGSSRRRFPALLAKLGQIDLFIHDSLHSERNVRFELDRAWSILRPGGAIIVDDIDANNGLHSFNEDFPAIRTLFVRRNRFTRIRGASTRRACSELF